MTAQTPIAELLAAFATGTSPNEIPNEVRMAASNYLADALGCAIGAAADPEAEVVAICRNYAARSTSREGATILGSRDRTDLRMAALVNSTLVRYLDANDIYMGTPGRDTGHFSDAIPAVLSTAEHVRATGRELITAIVIAYEAQAAMAESYLWMNRGFHSVSQVTPAVALACGRLLGLSAGELAHAVSLAVTSGMMVQTWLRPAAALPAIKGGAPGFAAERGIMCAELAGLGFTGPLDAFETLFERFPSDANRDPFTTLGETWRTPRNAIKPLPAQIYTQAAVQCAEELYRQGLRLDDMAALTVRSNEGATGRVQGAPEAFRPESREAADHSTPFVVAMTLRDGAIGLSSYADAAWLASDIRGAMSRMEMVIDAEWDRRLNEEGLLGADIEAHDRKGNRYHAEVRQFRGHPDLPLSADELLGKLKGFLDRPEALGNGAARNLFDLCLAIESAANVDDLIAACALPESDLAS